MACEKLTRLYFLNLLFRPGNEARCRHNVHFPRFHAKSFASPCCVQQYHASSMSTVFRFRETWSQRTTNAYIPKQSPSDISPHPYTVGMSFATSHTLQQPLDAGAQGYCEEQRAIGMHLYC